MRTATVGITVLPSAESGLLPPSKSHKRQSEENADAHSEYLSMSDEDYSEADSHENWKTVESRRTMRARKNASSQSSATIIEAAHMPELTVALVPTFATDSVMKLSRCQLSNFQESLVPGEIKEARVNSHKNDVAVDASTPMAVSTLLLTPTLCGMVVRSYVPRGKRTIVGVSQDVDCSVPELADLISSTTSVIEVRRFGTSQNVNIVFKGTVYLQR